MIKSEATTTLPSCCTSRDPNEQESVPVLHHDEGTYGAIGEDYPVNASSHVTLANDLGQDHDNEGVFLASWSPMARRILGAVLSVFSGMILSLSFTSVE